MVTPAKFPVAGFILDPADTAWMKRAACALSFDPGNDIFFPERGTGRPTSLSLARARAVCRHCPVRQECLEYALRHRISYGVWGGLSPGQRWYLLRQPRRQR